MTPKQPFMVVTVIDCLEERRSHKVSEINTCIIYEGTTSFNDGHVHEYSGCTGPSIPLPDGNHYH
ncbi:YmaF family protein [Brevibacillus choshinensis]|uniref:YmaF family protein n=1 Tax=Brevibacillus choshinensis TaxID=54911 RepID=UPI00399CFD24